MENDNLQEQLYGKTVSVALADGKQYVLRELDYDTFSSIQLSSADPNNASDIKKIAWALLKYDNPNLEEKRLGKLITFSMMKVEAPFMKAIRQIMGQEDDPKAPAEQTA